MRRSSTRSFGDVPSSKKQSQTLNPKHFCRHRPAAANARLQSGLCGCHHQGSAAVVVSQVSVGTGLQQKERLQHGRSQMSPSGQCTCELEQEPLHPPSSAPACGNRRGEQCIHHLQHLLVKVLKMVDALLSSPVAGQLHAPNPSSSAEDMEVALASGLTHIQVLGSSLFHVSFHCNET